MPDNYWEKEYNKIESKITLIFNNIITASNLLCDKSTVLNDFFKDVLCEMLISQVLRTMNAREYFDKIGEAPHCGSVIAAEYTSQVKCIDNKITKFPFTIGGQFK